MFVKPMFNHPHNNIKASYIGEGMKVADFGAGVGHHTLPIAYQVTDDGAVYAIDVQKDLLSKLKAEAEREHLTNVHVILGNVEKAGGSTLRAQSVDRVLIMNTLFQIEDKRTALAEAKRILKTKGRLVIIDWRDSYGHLGPHPDHVITKFEARRLAEGAGFKFESDFEAGAHHYGLLFKVS